MQLLSATTAFAGRLLTGLGIGATGSGWHEVLDALSDTAKATHVAASNGGSSDSPDHS
jgi:hypothetical protein